MDEMMTFKSGLLCRLPQTTHKIIKEISSFYREPIPIKLNYEYIYFAYLNNSESPASSLNEPVIKITHSSIKLLNPSSIRFTNTRIKLDTRTFTSGEEWKH